MNRECNVTKRLQTAKGPRYCPVILSSIGRIKPDMVLVNGVPERHPEGAYYLEWYEGKRRVRVSVANNAADANIGSAKRLNEREESWRGCRSSSIEQRTPAAVGCNRRMAGRDQTDEEAQNLCCLLGRA